MTTGHLDRSLVLMFRTVSGPFGCMASMMSYAARLPTQSHSCCWATTGDEQADASTLAGEQRPWSGWGSDSRSSVCPAAGFTIVVSHLCADITPVTRRRAQLRRQRHRRQHGTGRSGRLGERNVTSSSRTNDTFVGTHATYPSFRGDLIILYNRRLDHLGWHLDATCFPGLGIDSSACRDDVIN